MCGIFCMFAPNAHSQYNVLSFTSTSNLIKPILDRRGPDFQCSKNVELSNHSFLFSASVLWLQGKEITKQPIENDQSIFVFNGDVFGGTLISSDLRNNIGDSIPLLNLFEASHDLVKDLTNVHGPFAFIYLDKINFRLHFARDPYGRRSLLIGVKDNALILSSVVRKSIGVKFIELPAIGVFTYDLQREAIDLRPWFFKHSNFMNKIDELQTILTKNVNIIENIPAQSCKFIEPIDSDLNFLRQLHDDVFLTLLSNTKFLQNVEYLKTVLQHAIEKRIATQPNFCQRCMLNRANCKHSLVGVLFSGGIDCAILALLADKYTENDRPIDLLNVSFSETAPDRLTGLQTLAELRQLKPERQWNFIEINVGEAELNIERDRVIADLIYPLNSVLDDSLGCALWFAVEVRVVLLVGMGADELFGGYTKHRAALKRYGWIGLYDSLENDWQNISFRNLARDDRVVSDHGRQLRTPYLDENVVEFVRSLNCWERTCPVDYLPVGIGEKILLRCLAYYLGLKNAAGLKKRALQFGSRIANRKENANDVSPRLL